MYNLLLVSAALPLLSCRVREDRVGENSLLLGYNAHTCTHILQGGLVCSHKILLTTKLNQLVIIAFEISFEYFS